MSISDARQDQRAGLSGWGRNYRKGVEIRTEDLASASEHFPLSRGLGRSYGDASLLAKGDERALGTTLADRILSFDEATGLLTCEAGLCLAELNRIYLKRNWFTPVTPGTKFVTVGGMIASDVHGKNHHVSGTIGRHVHSLLIRTGSGAVVQCSREQHCDLFLATLGGMGLTGHILEVTLQMEKIPSPWIYSESYRLDNLEELLTRVKMEGKKWPMTVSWVDTIAQGKSMGRGILFVGRWAEPHEAKAFVPKSKNSIKMPISLPSWVLNRFTIGLFNFVLFHSHYPKVRRAVVDPDKYFYPLDFIQHWNRIYGSRGVTQHQSVIPNEAGQKGIRMMLEELAASNSSSFLTVIKDCGQEGDGLLSFPRPGMSLALDIPIRQNTPGVIAHLNKIVGDTGGRIYLTKDGLTTAEDFKKLEPRLESFLEVKKKWDPEGKIRSAQSERLMGI
jgi:decaprenylphospho-beta-D-ribofuranose 2-oxidase